MKILPPPHGNTSDLDSGATSMFSEPMLHCPEDANHKIVGSTRYVYCYECCKYWGRWRLASEAGKTE